MRRSFAMSVVVTLLEMSVVDAPRVVPWQETGLPVEPYVASTDPVEALRTSKYMHPVTPALDSKSRLNFTDETERPAGRDELKSMSTKRFDANVVVHAAVVRVRPSPAKLVGAEASVALPAAASCSDHAEVVRCAG